MKTAFFAAGCFWCITPVFRERDGVLGVTSGYSGGEEKNPRYEDVKSQKTGHREAVRIDYDEERVSFDALMDLFLNHVDPFDDGGQFIDRGYSYTLAVYWTEERERVCAEEAIRGLQQSSGRQVFVSVEPFRGFYEAEAYHQDYDLKNPDAFEKELRESGRNPL